MELKKKSLLTKFAAATVSVILCMFLLVACIDGNGGVTANTESGNETKTAHIGDTIVNSDNVSITLVSCENTKQLGTELLNDTTENNFILLTVKVKNDSKKQQTFYGGCAFLYNSEGTKYEETTSLYIDYILSEDIGVGISKTFQMVFETPTTTAQEKYTVKIGYSQYTSETNRAVFDLSN